MRTFFCPGIGANLASVARYIGDQGIRTPEMSCRLQHPNAALNGAYRISLLYMPCWNYMENRPIFILDVSLSFTSGTTIEISR
jgi:hypothetical protein